MITVMGATGRTGSHIVRSLLEAGEPVRALGRSAERLAPLAALGADVRAGDASDAAHLADAFRGAAAVYALLPYEPHVPGCVAAQRARSEAIVHAVRDAGVPHVVALSSLGAERPDGTGLIAPLHAHEARLRTLTGTHVLLLRAGFFLENFEAALAVIPQIGVHADSVAPEVPLPMVATRDVADAATRALRARDWTGVVVRELLGPCDLTHEEATRVMGAHLGQPALAYVRLTDAEMARTLVQAGFAEDVAALYVEMTRAFNEGRVRAHGRRTGDCPTTLEDVLRAGLGAMR